MLPCQAGSGQLARILLLSCCWCTITQVHAANGYIIDQFWKDNTNLRTDAYGGSTQNKARCVLEMEQLALCHLRTTVLLQSHMLCQPNPGEL
jgi:hypothetical protein